jgi:two-component system NarL family sensor kinase
MLSRELGEVRLRLREAEEALHAIRGGEVDAVVVAGKLGSQVFTLQGADHAYRMLIESMNEGALTLTTDQMILYANQSFAKMVKCSLEQVIGSSFRRFLSADDQAKFQPLVKRAGKTATPTQALLVAGDGSRLPAQISIRAQESTELRGAAISVVVTDMSEARRTEGLLRALTHRVVQVQESERERVAFELHDNITQLLCAVVFRSQLLVDTLPAGNGPSKTEAMKVRDMLGKIAEEVGRITHNMGPSTLDHLGLVAVLRDAKTQFAERTGVSITLTCMKLSERPAANTELALYRILQEALRNVEKHANAHHVTVCLSQQGAFVQLLINDDGIGFDPELRPSERKEKGGLGLVSMRERASFVGGTLTIKSVSRAGTKIEVLVPSGSH